MGAKPKILAFAGSARKQSLNKKLILCAADALKEAGAVVTVLDLSDYPLPLYHGDEEEQGMPEHLAELKKLFLSHDGLLVSSPEYNSGLTPLLKNVIDWVSRFDETPLACYQGKVVGLMAASPGGLGGIRVLPQVRSIFQNIGCLVIPKMLAVSGAHKAFGDDGQLIDERQRTALQELTKMLVDTLQRLKS